MIPLKIAVPTAPLGNPLRRAIAAAAETGAGAVMFDARHEIQPKEFGETAIRQLRYLLKEYNLEIAGLTLPVRRSLCDPDLLDARLAAVRNAMEFAFRLGAGLLTVRLGTIPADAESAEYRQMTTILSDLAALGNRVGTTLALSTIGNAPDQMKALLDTIRDGPIGVDLDPAGFLFAGVPPAAALRELHAFLQHIQIRDGIQTAEGSGIETAIGAGEVPWDEFLATIMEVDYHGWMTICRTEGSQQSSDIARGVQYVRNVLLT